ncbi:universal stress protein, partial [Pyrinomonas sp.]|uniref:universal stress protein n=1 Tax=Pyrinomonas sp. TaxID=2080306 RepID=UPI00331D8E9F
RTKMSNVELKRPSPEALLAKIKESSRPWLRVYIGAAPGVGKTYQMLEDAHEMRKRGVDVVIGFIETHGRAETEALIGDLEVIPRKRIEYKGVTLEEMDLEAILRRRPEVVLVDELAHTNPPGMKHRKRYEDVLELLEHGISVVTAVNVQHIESLNDVVASITGVRVRETVPDWFFKRADEVVNVDVSVETLRTRLRQGKIYDIDRIEHALNNFFRKGNLSALRELALRQVAEDQETKARDYREREGLDQAPIPGRVMVCMASRGNAEKLLRLGARMAGRFAHDWYAVYVETPEEEPGRIKPEDYASLQDNIALARELGAQVVKLRANNRRRIADALIEFARQHAITHVIFGQSARSRLDILLRGSIINRFLREVRDVTVQVVPMNQQERE